MLLFAFLVVLAPSRGLALDLRDLQVHYLFDEPASSTTIVDNAGGEEFAVCTDCPTFGVTGIRGTAISCDGTNDEVDIDGDNNSSLIFDAEVSQRTIMMWYNATGVTDQQFLFEEGGRSNGLEIYIVGGRIYVGAHTRLNNFGGVWNSASTTAGVWHHIALVLDVSGSQTIELYHDGVLIESNAFTSNVRRHTGNDGICFNNGSSLTHLGQSNTSDRFEGLIDDFYVLDRPLSGTEITDYLSEIPAFLSLELNETSGSTSFTNSEGGYADGSCSGATCPTAETITPQNTGLDFDGVDDLISLDPAAGTNPPFQEEVAARTIALCVRPSDLSGTEVVFEQGDSTQGLNVYLDGTSVFAGGWSVGQGFNGSWASAALTANSWHHIAFTYDAISGTTSTLYLDGAQVATANATTSIADSTDGVALGAVQGETRTTSGPVTAQSLPFDGRIDQLTVSYLPLTLAEIGTLSSSCLTSSDAVASLDHSPEPWQAGTSGTLTATVTSTGTGNVSRAPLVHTIPGEFTNLTWTCTATGGAVCDDLSGTGSPSTIVDLPPGGQIEIEVAAEVPLAQAAATPSQTLVVTNTLDAVSADNSASDQITIEEPPNIDVAVTISRAPSGQPVAGTNVTYTITVSNEGNTLASSTAVTTTLQSILLAPTWTCAAAGSSSCANALGTGSISESVDVATDGDVVFMLTGRVDPTASGTLLTSANVAVTGDSVSGNNDASDSVAIAREVNVAITKQRTSGAVVAGASVVYEVTATNSEASTASNALITDTLPGTLSSISWNCTAAGGASCTNGSGSGSISESVDIPQNGTITFTINTTLDSSATGTLQNTATISHPEDVTSGNNSSTTNDSIAQSFDVSFTSTTSTNPMARGQPGVCVFTVSNAGPSDAPASTITASIPAEFLSGSWTCQGDSGGSCTANGTGSINESSALPAGGMVTFTLTGEVLDTIATSGTVSCSGSASTAGDNNSGNDSSLVNVPYSTIIE